MRWIPASAAAARVLRVGPVARDSAAGLKTDHAEHLVTAALHVLARGQRLQAQPQQRLGVRGAHVEVPVVVVDRDPVEAVLARVGVALGQLSILASPSETSELISPEMKYRER